MLVRKRRRAFFSAPPQGDDHRQRVAEDASDLALGNEAGEAVEVEEAFDFGHPRIVTSSPSRRKAAFAGKRRGKSALAIESYPHDFTKSPLNFSRPCTRKRFVE